MWVCVVNCFHSSIKCWLTGKHILQLSRARVANPWYKGTPLLQNRTVQLTKTTRRTYGERTTSCGCNLHKTHSQWRGCDLHVSAGLFKFTLQVPKQTLKITEFFKGIVTDILKNGDIYWPNSAQQRGLYHSLPRQSERKLLILLIFCCYTSELPGSGVCTCVCRGFGVMLKHALDLPVYS